MSTIPQALAMGVQRHQLGHFDAAEQIYRDVLTADPCQVDALHLLGVLAFQLGNREAAIEHIGQALRLNPTHAPAHLSLGEVLLAQGKFDEAIASLRHALALRPDAVEVYVTLGNALADRGRLDEAIDLYRRALQLNPNDADGLNNLGLALAEQGRAAEAIVCYRRAFELSPNSPRLLSNLGGALRDAGKLGDAIACFRRALELAPDFPEVLNNLGNVLAEDGQVDEAVVCLRRAIELKPDYADPHNNLGVTLREQGRVPEAIACLRRAVELKPEYVDAHKTLGMYLLLQGDLQSGWAEYEWRLRTRALYRPPLPQPLWDGGPLEGRTILLRAEQGLGDTLQFVRFAAHVRQRGGRTILECPTPLVRLIETSGSVDRVVPIGEPLPPFDYYASLLGLPHLLGLSSVERIPADIPYLRADAELAEFWRRELARYQGLKVGIVWRGGRRNQADLRLADRRRSISLSHLEPLTRVPGVRLFSLQKDGGTEELEQWGEKWGIVDLAARLEDFSDTAAVMTNLELIISADTSPTHLAGALGRPTWTALPFAGCWRWLERREDTPWYPTMRLFRQDRPNAWDGVFERMADALRLKFLGGSPRTA